MLFNLYEKKNIKDVGLRQEWGGGLFFLLELVSFFFFFFFLKFTSKS